MINLDQLYAREPVTEFTGSEVVPVQKAGVTGASLASALKTYFKAGFVATDITNSSAIGRSVLTAANLAAVKTLLEIPAPTPAPSAPLTVSTNTTVSATHINRRTFVTAGVTLTMNAVGVSNTDYIHLINTSGSSVTINAGSGEDIRVKGGTGTVTTYSLAENGSVRACLIDSNSWYFEI